MVGYFIWATDVKSKDQKSGTMNSYKFEFLDQEKFSNLNYSLFLSYGNIFFD
jgi:hypothetical protein